MATTVGFLYENNPNKQPLQVGDWVEYNSVPCIVYFIGVTNLIDLFDVSANCCRYGVARSDIIYKYGGVLISLEDKH